MDYYVYILQSELGVYYKGYTSHPLLRLEEHNQGRSRYTSSKGPWKLVYLEKMPDKKSALIREKQIKRANHNYLQWLIKSDLNIVSDFILPE
jgi:putative endonuclease